MVRLSGALFKLLVMSAECQISTGRGANQRGALSVNQRSALSVNQRGALSALLTSFDVMSTIWIMRS
jgi:hypothetical protein